MTEKRRDLMQRVADDHPGAPPYLYLFDRITRCDEVLDWFIRSRLTGQAFVDFIRYSCQGSVLHAISRAIQGLEGEKQLRPLYAGRDFLNIFQGEKK